jgi:hypothetical protein
MSAPMTPPERPPLPPTGGPMKPPGTPRTPTYAPPEQTPPRTRTMYTRMGGQNNLLGWLAVLFGIIGTGCCCCWFLDGSPFVGGIPAIILGWLHLRRVKRYEATMKWLGWLGIALGVIALLGAICNFGTHWNDDLHNRLVTTY